jgi:prevent-host-death family protein
MSAIPLFEAKNKLSSLLDQVAEGEEFLITRHGKPAARLAPVTPMFDRAKAEQAAKALLEARKGVSLGGLTIKELRQEGRR